MTLDMPTGADKTAPESLREAVRIISGSGRVLAMTGAGLSVASGIPTFRGDDGLWSKFGEPTMDGYQKFLADPASWWRREITKTHDPYVLELRHALEQAQPNSAHRALADLERSGILIATITQNVDGLEERAGMQRLIEIHGNRSKLRCIVCGRRTPRGTFVPPADRPPRCIECDGLIKYDSVMFGEPVPPDRLAAARAEADRADCIIAIGTSATVRPASGLMWIAESRGARVVEINPNPTKLSAVADVTVRAPAVEALPALAEMTRAG